MTEIAFPFAADAQGRTRGATPEEHIRHLIEQVLFTAPGERVNRPGFGAGLLELVFGPNSPELAATTEATVQSALNQWLGDRIQVRGVRVQASESRLLVLVSYTILQSQELRSASFVRET